MDAVGGDSHHRIVVELKDLKNHLLTSYE